VSHVSLPPLTASTAAAAVVSALGSEAAAAAGGTSASAASKKLPGCDSPVRVQSGSATADLSSMKGTKRNIALLLLFRCSYLSECVRACVRAADAIPPRRFNIDPSKKGIIIPLIFSLGAEDHRLYMENGLSRTAQAKA
jgi:hypothetical protein